MRLVLLTCVLLTALLAPTSSQAQWGSVYHPSPTYSCSQSRASGFGHYHWPSLYNESSQRNMDQQRLLEARRQTAALRDIARALQPADQVVPIVETPNGGSDDVYGGHGEYGRANTRFFRSPPMTRQREPLKSPPPAQLRVWTDSTGIFSTEATFKGVIGTTVRLERLDGTIVAVQMAQLSEDDRAWIDTRRRRGEAAWRPI